VFTKPRPRLVLVDIKTADVRGDVTYVWWATVDRHPYSDKQGYETPEAAKRAAEAWASEHYPNRRVVHQGDET
jgi:hypothetical protein